MSFDFATNQLCTHEVFFERLFLNGTRQLATFLRPPSSQRVDVYVDGMLVPPTGLYSYAMIPFRTAEPYRIRSGQNDLLYIGIGFDAPRLVQLITGPDLRARDVAADLQRQIPELSVTVKNRRVLFRSRQRTGGTGFRFPDPRWTDPTSSLPSTVRILETFRTLGINPGRHVRGQRIFPGWSVVPDAQDLTGFTRRLAFEDPLEVHDAVVEVNYVTDAANCRRCHGSRIEFDYRIVDGTYETVRDTDLLAQEFDKFLFTKIGTHWKWNWLGSPLVERVGGKGSTAFAAQNALISVDISQTFRVYQNIKLQQDTRFPFQRVSDAEYPTQISDLDIKTLPDDPTVAVVTVSVVSRSRVPVELKRVVGNPNPYTLLNDPRQNIRLGNRGSASTAFLRRG